MTLLLNPYVWLAAALALLLSFAGGCQVQKGRDAEALGQKNAALENAAVALRACKAAILEINAEARRRVSAAEAQKKAADAGAAVLLAENSRLEERNAADEAAWAKAKTRKPGCAELLAADLTKTCGVKAR